jgi:hypothetical protein
MNLYPNLITRTRLPIAETRDLKISVAANSLLSGPLFPLELLFPRLPALVH